MAPKNKKTPAHDKDSPFSEIISKFKANPAVFTGTVIILVLVIVSFVLVPALTPGARAGGSVDLTFGYYDKVPISYVPGNYFAQTYEWYSQYYRDSINQDNYFYANANLWYQAFESAAVYTAVLHEVKKSGYTVPVKTVDQEVAKLPQFQENGRFSAALYQSMASNSRLALWRQINDELTQRQYYSDLSGLAKSSAEGTFIAKMASPQRSFDMVFFSVDDFPDYEYMAYADENPGLFRSIHLSRISAGSSEREARQILDSIKNGSSSFEDAARAYSQDSYADRGGDMGIRLIYELEQEIAQADMEKITGLGKGEYSDVIKDGENWAFFRVEEGVRPADVNDEAVMEKIRSHMRSFNRGRMEDWAVAQARDFIADAKAYGFDTALRRQGKEKSSFGPLPINYGDVDLFATLGNYSIPELSNSSTDENFWKAIFSAPVNAFSEPVVQGNNVVVFLPTEQTKADEYTIEAIASTFSVGRSSFVNQSIHTYFLNSDKLDNRFWDTYFRYFMPMGN